MKSSNTNHQDPFRAAVLSVVKHAYVPHGMFSHPRFVPVVVADDADQPDWAHQRNQKFADEYGVPYIQDVERAISEYDAQLAIVSSAAERHCDLGIRAANAGLHVVQDKPMSTGLAECDRMIEAVESNGVSFMMWNRNFLPALQHALEIIRRGELGELQAIHVDFYFAKDAGPPAGSRKPDDPPINWEQTLIAANATGADGGLGKDPMGELQIEGIYPLAYIQMLAGVEIKRVFARTTAHFHQLCVDNQVDDLATVTLEMEQGLVGSLSIGRIGNASHPDIGEIKLHILGSQAALVLSEARPEIGVYYRGQPDREFRHVRLAIDNDWLLADNFARAMDTGEDSILNARQSRAICATVLAAVESGQTGKPVDVDVLNAS